MYSLSLGVKFEIQSDNGGEFDKKFMHDLFATNDIQFWISCPRTSQQNGKSETMIRTIVHAQKEQE